METFMEIIILVLVLAIIGHMLYEIFFKKKVKMYTPDDFRQLRIDAGKPNEASEEENMQAGEILESIYDGWPVVEVTDDNEYHAPLKTKEMKASALLINQVIDIAPTDEALVDRFNELADVLNGAQKRSFNGSKTLIIVALIMFVLLSLISGTWSGAVFFIGSIVVYILASMTPNYVINRKIMKNNGRGRSFMSSLIGGLFGGIASAKTYKWVNKNTGEVVDTDNSETWISMIFTFIVLFLLSSFIGAIALINYIRNYWLFI